MVRPGALALVGAALLTIAFVARRSVPVLSLVDLGFHELAHLLAIPFGRTIHFLAGSVGQIAVPAGLAWYFWRSRADLPAAGLLLAWTATSMANVSVYVADAPHRRLPLIGGTHDWAWLLGRWGLIDRAGDFAGLLFTMGALTGLVGLVVTLWPIIGDRDRRDDRPPAQANRIQPPRYDG